MADLVSGKILHYCYSTKKSYGSPCLRQDTPLLLLYKEILWQPLSQARYSTTATLQRNLMAALVSGKILHYCYSTEKSYGSPCLRQDTPLVLRYKEILWQPLFQAKYSTTATLQRNFMAVLVSDKILHYCYATKKSHGSPCLRQNSPLLLRHKEITWQSLFQAKFSTTATLQRNLIAVLVSGKILHYCYSTKKSYGSPCFRQNTPLLLLYKEILLQSLLQAKFSTSATLQRNLWAVLVSGKILHYCYTTKKSYCSPCFRQNSPLLLHQK